MVNHHLPARPHWRDHSHGQFGIISQDLILSQAMRGQFPDRESAVLTSDWKELAMRMVQH